jgi:hypothetical protein
LNNAVKDNDRLFPPDWRLSYGSRPRNTAASGQDELERLRQQLTATQQQLQELERRLGNA